MYRGIILRFQHLAVHIYGLILPLCISEMTRYGELEMEIDQCFCYFAAKTDACYTLMCITNTLIYLSVDTVHCNRLDFS